VRQYKNLFTVLLATAATVAAVDTGSAWPGAGKSPANADLIVLAQMGGMGGGMGGGGMGGGMGGGGMRGGGGGMGGGGMGGMGGGGMGGMGGGGMGGMGGGGMGGMGGGGMGGMGGGGMGGMGGGGMGGMGGGGMGGMGGMGGGGMGGMGGNVNINRNVNVHVRGVRPWVNRTWYGTAIAGVTLGTIIAVSAAPAPPADNLCWFWTSSAEDQGYWDWCVPPP
jgi:hypothetical protein